MADDPAFMAAAADGKTPVRNRPGGQTEAYCEIRVTGQRRVSAVYDKALVYGHSLFGPQFHVWFVADQTVSDVSPEMAHAQMVKRFGYAQAIVGTRFLPKLNHSLLEFVELLLWKEQAEELRIYEEKIHHWADKMEPMDLDDGVKANYAKFQELLTKIK